MITGLIIAAFALPSSADDATTASHSFESCSLITSEYVTVLQLASRGLSGEVLKDTLPGLSDKAEERLDALLQMARTDGFVDTYSTVNSEYARCAARVFKANGMPRQGSRESHFHFCAGENKVRYEVLLAALVGAPQEKVLGQLHSRHREASAAIYELYQAEGELAVFDSLGTELKHCLKGN